MVLLGPVTDAQWTGPRPRRSGEGYFNCSVCGAHLTEIFSAEKCCVGVFQFLGGTLGFSMKRTRNCDFQGSYVCLFAYTLAFQDFSHQAKPFFPIAELLTLSLSLSQMTINLMNSYYPKSCSSFLRRRGYKSPCWAWKHPRSTHTYYPTKITKICYMKNSQIRELDVTACKISFITKASKSTERSVGDPIKEKGTVAGAVALIIGTSIGSGILALPKKTSPAGFIPSATSMIFCWGFLLIEALLLAEINVGLRNDKKKRGEEDATLEIISIRTMAQETLGHWGGTLVTVNYIFLAYASMVAYTSKSGEILSHVINLPTSVCGIFFTALFTLLISVGGTHLTDWINQWLTASMIGLLVMIEVIAAFSGGWSGLSSTANWNKVPVTIPVIIFSLVYHDLAPVLCTYLGGDLRRIRLSVVVGSIVPLVALLVWDAVALGLSQHADGIDPVELLMRLSNLSKFGWNGEGCQLWLKASHFLRLERP